MKCDAIEGRQELQIVAIGTVFIEDATKATIHCHGLPPGHRRVSVLEAIVPNALLPCPTEEWTVVVQATHSFVKWPSHLIFPRNMADETETSKNAEKQLSTSSPRPCSSQGSCTRKYVITEMDRAKLTTDLLKVSKNEAMVMKRNNEKIVVPIPACVSYFSHDVELNYEDMLDWCFQREIGASHVSAYMNRHWMLAVISPWNGMVWWLDPAGPGNENHKFAQEIINEGIIKFSLEHRKDIKKMKKNPFIKWTEPSCPRQPIDSLDCGFYVCRYMLETIAKRQQVIPEQYFKDVPKTYPQ